MIRKFVLFQFLIRSIFLNQLKIANMRKEKRITFHHVCVCVCVSNNIIKTSLDSNRFSSSSYWKEREREKEKERRGEREKIFLSRLLSLSLWLDYAALHSNQ